jgi:hypothetical protein
MLELYLRQRCDNAAYIAWSLRLFGGNHEALETYWGAIVSYTILLISFTAWRCAAIETTHTG